MLYIGDQIRDIRLKRGYNQEQLAELANLNRVTIAKYESGKIEPGAQALSRIADALEVSVDELLGRNTDTVPENDQQQFQTREVRILARGMGKMPKEAREKILSMAKLMYDEYADYFTDERNDNDAE